MTSSKSNDLNSAHSLGNSREPELGSSKKLGEPPCSLEGSEFSAPLETAIPLEAPRSVYVAAPSYVAAPRPVPPSSPSLATAAPTTPALAAPFPVAPAPSVRRPDEVTISLLDERVIVDRKRQKIGEVVIRKEIETRIVEVPVRREKLIVEQVSPQYKQLTVVELGQATADETSAAEADAPLDVLSVSAEFASIQEAIRFLSAIAADPSAGSQKVQMQLLATHAAQRDACERWLEQFV